MKKGFVAKVDKLPFCDICHKRDLSGGKLPTEAKYDGKTKMGLWANMCEDCFQRYGIGLGEGVGQTLEVQ